MHACMHAYAHTYTDIHTTWAQSLSCLRIVVSEVVGKWSKTCVCVCVCVCAWMSADECACVGSTIVHTYCMNAYNLYSYIAI